MLLLVWWYYLYDGITCMMLLPVWWYYLYDTITCMMLLPVWCRLHIPQTFQLSVFFDKLECSLFRPFAWHFPFCACATENYHKLGSILQCAIFNVNSQGYINHTVQDTALCCATPITTTEHSLLLLNEIQLHLHKWQHSKSGKNIHISWLLIYCPQLWTEHLSWSLRTYARMWHPFLKKGHQQRTPHYPPTDRTNIRIIVTCKFLPHWITVQSWCVIPVVLVQ